jgi:hypothetical protein
LQRLSLQPTVAPGAYDVGQLQRNGCGPLQSSRADYVSDAALYGSAASQYGSPAIVHWLRYRGHERLTGLGLTGVQRFEEAHFDFCAAVDRLREAARHEWEEQNNEPKR